MSAGDAFGSWLRRQLERSEMSQAELAERLNLTRAAVSAWVNGRAVPRNETKQAIAEVFGVELSAVHDFATDVAVSLPLGWYHRRAHIDGGREYGNAAAFAFDADLAALAREATQNSLDEQADRAQPVRVRFTLNEISGGTLQAFLAAIQWQELKRHFDSAASAPQKVSRSLHAALEELRDTGTLLLLRIDDYNAAGLTGPDYGDGRFAAVVRRQLDSHKAGDRAGGSYGLGKATLWATSRFGLVLMNSTLSEPHEGRTRHRTVGRLDLPWHEVDGDSYAGPAWFGEPDAAAEHKGVSRSWWADEEMLRELHLERTGDEPGTSFLVVGAHDASGDAESLQEMHEKLVHSLANDFWAAMVGGNRAGPLLEAHVATLQNGQTFIPEERVDPYARHPGLSRALKAYLDDTTVSRLTEAEQVAAVQVPLTVTPRKGTGRGRDKGCEHQAVLLLTAAANDSEHPNRVVLMRGSRMRITEHRPRELPLGAMPFQGVLLAGYATERDEVDVKLAEEFLRASEPPEHDRWDRTEELTSLYERGALTRLREFRGEIDKAVRALVARRESVRKNGPESLRDLLKFEGSEGTAARRPQGFPTVHGINAGVLDSGAWKVTVTVKVPESQDPWQITPIAKFDVRSGGRPTVDWAMLSATENCQIVSGDLLIPPGTRSASFTGVTNPDTHPVRSRFARLVVDLVKTRGGTA
ncbi:helix-turn-helix transcriptional regulator [Glycomyces tritici]|uniref:Helix-turn-helix transcriptional regulator n=1 Tax=Glycomyces tritici TaxID=2665176 RepID=A0ABT7YJ64_9ACTN|nr:helix-turn-helix transcriptional regulator [Glycomyces tritici]MDN3238679.1 helix-turn-helix transcriptional regulator [Glycomyces tritici]